MPRPGQTCLVTRKKLPLSIKTLCLLGANTTWGKRGSKRDHWFISTSHAQRLLFLPEPVTCGMSPLPGEFAGKPASPALCRWAAERPSCPDTREGAVHGPDVVARGPVEAGTCQHRSVLNLLRGHFIWIAVVA